jgi:hypothetical protein
MKKGDHLAMVAPEVLRHWGLKRRKGIEGDQL